MLKSIEVLLFPWSTKLSNILFTIKMGNDLRIAGS